MREIEEKAARAYEERFREEPELVASAPERINLIGEYTGFNGGFVLPCAIERRIASVGAALLIDCQTLESAPVPLDLEAAGLALLICEARPRRHRLRESPQKLRERRAEARRRGVARCGRGRLDRLSGEELKHVHHVVRENACVLEAARALREGDFASFGRLRYDSHLSLRDAFEVSTPELDTFVDAARESGALGAWLAGAGSGGCAFEERSFEEPAFYEFQPVAGAESRVKPCRRYTRLFYLQTVPLLVCGTCLREAILG